MKTTTERIFDRIASRCITTIEELNEAFGYEPTQVAIHSLKLAKRIELSRHDHPHAVADLRTLYTADGRTWFNAVAAK